MFVTVIVYCIVEYYFSVYDGNTVQYYKVYLPCYNGSIAQYCGVNKSPIYNHG